MLGRYFYFESNGSNKNDSSHLIEIQIFDSTGVNRAYGRGVYRYSSVQSGYETRGSLVTDGDFNMYYDLGDGAQHVVIDIGGIYEIAYIKVWRYYNDGRIYKDVFVKVSTDDIVYETVFSSEENGTYSESSSGYTIELPPSSETEYIDLEYIEANGSQYIDTGVIAKTGLKVEIQAELTKTTNYQAFFGSQESGPKNRFAWYYYQSNQLYFYYGSKVYPFVTRSDFTSKHIYTFDDNEAYIDGTKVSFNVTIPDESFVGTKTMYLFAQNNTSGVSDKAYMKLYYCKMWLNGTLIRDFVPCVTNYGAVGMLDLVENKFYGTKTSTNFIASPISEDDAQYVTNIVWRLLKRKSTDSYGAIQAADFNLYDEDGNKIPWIAAFTTVECPLSTWSGEEVDKLIDENSSTKWGCTGWGNVVEGVAEVKFKILSLVRPYYYSYTTASDVAERDPVSWDLLYSTNDDDLVVISSVRDATITGSRKTETQKWEIEELPDPPGGLTKTKGYLLRSGSSIYTVADGELVELEEKSLTPELFSTYCVNKIPSCELILTLENPEILYWTEKEDANLPEIKATLIAVPPPQTIVTCAIDLSDETIKGIETVAIDCDGTPLVAVSFDNKATWKAYDGTQWVDLSANMSGMSKEIVEAIPIDKWSEIRGESTEMFVRMFLTSADQVIRQIYIDFIN